MDEPFGALDAHTKLVMQEELATIFKTQLTTTVMVTHDVEEAIYLSDAILIMSGRPGRLIEFIEVGLKKPRDRSDHTFVSLRFDILRRAFGDPAPGLPGNSSTLEHGHTNGAPRCPHAQAFSRESHHLNARLAIHPIPGGVPWLHSKLYFCHTARSF